MQLGDDPQQNAETLFVEDDVEKNHRTLEDLTSRAEQLKQELLNASDDLIFEDHPNLLEDTLSAARAALEKCRSARSELQTAREQHAYLCSTWNEIQRRRKFLTELKTALLEVRQLSNVAQLIVDAKNRRDHDTMSKACVVFEHLNSKGAVRLDDTYECLHSISERVSLAVAESMRILRNSLRIACKGFHPSEYRKCMKSFSDLGALSHFSSHVLQIFDEEAMKLFRDAVQQEGKAFPIVMAFSAELHDLLAQFARIISFHVSIPAFEESKKDEELRRSVASSFRSKQLPFRRFAELAARLVDEHRFTLISEQPKTLLTVFESFNYLSDTAIAAGDALLEQQYGEAPFRSKQKLTTHRDALREREGVALRRAPSHSRLEDIPISSESSRSERRAWRSDIRSPISKALKEVASGCLKMTHARHAEEMSVITQAPECWVRVRMSEDTIRQMLEDVLGGTEGRIHRALQNKSDMSSDRMSCTDLGSGLLETNPSAWTLTTASISVLRWMSEYATIGITEPSALSESLSNATDLFLMFLYASIDMKSRVRVPEAVTWFKSIEDVLLERPRTKTVADFMPPDMLQMFQTFMNRYDASQKTPPAAEDNNETERWGYEQNIALPHYRDAVGVTFSNAFTSHEAIIRQCVAAEGIGTLCAVMQTYFECVEGLVRCDQRLSEAYEVQKMASLRASLVLGKAVQKAFYELLAWDIIGGWDAVSAVAETYRSFHLPSHPQREMTATSQSTYIDTMVERIQCCYLESNIPPQAAEELGMVVCSTAMAVLLDGFACVRRIGFASAASQALVDVRTLEMTLVELTGIHPCPGCVRTEMYVKAAFLEGKELEKWIEQHRRRLNLLDRHVHALQYDEEDFEVPIVDQIITP